MTYLPTSPLRRLGGLLTLVTLALATHAGALGTAAGTAINNTASMSATDDAGNTANANSNTVTATVTQVYNVNLGPDGTASAPGQTVYVDSLTGATNGVLTYTLTNTGNGSDSDVISTNAVSSTVTAANVTYYVPASGDTSGVYNPSTAVKVTGPISLAADASTKVFAVYSIPQGAAGGTNYDINPQAQSVATGSSTSPAGPTDSNNYGRITEVNDYKVTIAATETGTITSSTGASKSYTSTVTNAGNVALTAAQLSVTASSADTNSAGTALASGAFTQGTYTATYNGNTGSGSTPNAAISSLLGSTGTLPAGSAITLTSVLSDDGKRAAGDKDVLTLAASVTGVTTSSSTANSSSTATSITKTTTVVKGASSITKTQALCGTSGSTAPANCPASSGASSSGINVRPGDYVVYYLAATNSGTSALFTTKVADALPSGVMIYSLGATVTGNSGTVLYSTDGSTWSSDATKLSGITGGSSTVYVGVDTDGDGKITSSDTFAAGAKILFRVKVKVNDGGTVQTAPVSDSQTIN